MNIANYINTILAKFGISLVRLPALESIYDVSSSSNNPYSLLYYVTNQDSVLTTLPLSRARDPFFFSLAPHGNHPYVVAAREALRSTHKRQVIYDVLRHYYGQVQPKTSAEYLGVRFSPASDLAAAPPWGFVWPWEARTAKEKMDFEVNSSRKIAQDDLGKDDMNLMYGWKFAGPISEELLSNETLRIEQLLESLITHGYERSERKDGDIVGVALEGQDGEWRWSISSGLHRAAILSALGYKSVPVRIRAMVRLKDVEIWPNVLNGLYSARTAKEVFLNLYNAKPSPALEKWSDY